MPERKNMTETTANTALSFFITGATGCVGRAITPYLVAQGHRVTGMAWGTAEGDAVRAVGGLPFYADPYRAGEIRSGLAMAEADVLLHLAPQIPNHVPHQKADWNVHALTEGTAAALQAAQAADVKFFVHTSYAFLYGDTGGEWVDEDAPSHAPGDNLVFQAALEAEQMVLNSGLPACVLRVGYVYGPQCAALADLRNALRRSVNVGEATAWSNWIYIDDLAHALLQAAVQKEAGVIFNIVDDTPTTPGEFANYFAQSRGLPQPDAGLMGFLNRPGKEQAALLKNAVKVKNDRAKTRLDWQPKYPSYREGLDQTLLAWRAEEAKAIRT